MQLPPNKMRSRFQYALHENFKCLFRRRPIYTAELQKTEKTWAFNVSARHATHVHGNWNQEIRIKIGRLEIATAVDTEQT